MGFKVLFLWTVSGIGKYLCGVLLVWIFNQLTILNQTKKIMLLSFCLLTLSMVTLDLIFYTSKNVCIDYRGDCRKFQLFKMLGGSKNTF